MKKKKRDNSDDKLFAFLGIFLTIIGFVIAILVRKDNKYVMFYAKQGLILFIAFVISGVLSWIPFIGWAFSLLVLAVWIIGIIYSLSGEMKDIPVIGELAKKIKI